MDKLVFLLDRGWTLDAIRGKCIKAFSDDAFIETPDSELAFCFECLADLHGGLRHYYEFLVAHNIRNVHEWPSGPLGWTPHVDPNVVKLYQKRDLSKESFEQLYGADLKQEPVQDWTPKVIDAKIAFRPEQWDDPGPAICGAGARLRSRTYNAFEDGHYEVEFTDAQMSTFALERQLLPSFRLITSDEVYELSRKAAKSKTECDEQWLEWISETLDDEQIGFERNIEIQSRSCKYVGAGRFNVAILEAACPYDPSDYQPDYDDE